jgi:hypothetical protein
LLPCIIWTGIARREDSKWQTEHLKLVFIKQTHHFQSLWRELSMWLIATSKIWEDYDSGRTFIVGQSSTRTSSTTGFAHCEFSSQNYAFEFGFGYAGGDLTESTFMSTFATEFHRFFANHHYHSKQFPFQILPKLWGKITFQIPVFLSLCEYSWNVLLKSRQMWVVNWNEFWMKSPEFNINLQNYWEVSELVLVMKFPFVEMSGYWMFLSEIEFSVWFQVWMWEWELDCSKITRSSFESNRITFSGHPEFSVWFSHSSTNHQLCDESAFQKSDFPTSWIKRHWITFEWSWFTVILFESPIMTFRCSFKKSRWWHMCESIPRGGNMKTGKRFEWKTRKIFDGFWKREEMNWKWRYDGKAMRGIKKPVLKGDKIRSHVCSRLKTFDQIKGWQIISLNLISVGLMMC